MKLYVARHGETAWNKENLIIGRTDMPLTKLGEQQAAGLAQALSGQGITQIITSPLLRAKQTAQAVGAVNGAPILEDARLLEQDFGSFEGTSRLAPEYLAAKLNFAVRLPRGESVLDMAYRVYAALHDYRQRFADETVLLTTHNSVMRVLATYFKDIDSATFQTMAFPNAQAVYYEL